MTFFNRKEEVMDIQLTQYGKYLLTKGKFKPAFYAFSDDDIIYDTAYGGEPKEFSEEPFNRVSSVPRIKTIYNITSVEQSVKELNEHNFRKAVDRYGNSKQEYLKSANKETKTPIEDIYGVDNIESLSMQVENRTILKNLLGTSELGNIEYPAWDINSLTTMINKPYVAQDENNKIVSHTIPLQVSSSTDLPYQKRYQLEFRPSWIVYNAPEGTAQTMGLSEAETGFADVVSNLDGGRELISLEKPDTILDVKEKNVFPTRENFDIEVFEIVDLQESQEKFLKKLFFTSDLEDPSLIPEASRVETFLEINFDSDIIITQDMENDSSLFNRAILQNALGQFFNSKNSDNIKIFSGEGDSVGRNPMLNLTPSSDDIDKNKIIPTNINRSAIGDSLYDFNRDLDEDGDCE